MLAPVILGTYRQRVLGLLLLHPDQSYYVREIARLTNTSAGTVHKELRLLVKVGLLLRDEVGNQVRYSANRHCLIFEELSSILRKTSGLTDVLTEALAGAKQQLDLAFVFGSTARGESQEGSDVDIMLVGSLSFAEIVKLLHPTEAILQREINPIIYTLQEFLHRVRNNDSFIQEVLSKPKLFIVGNEDELRKLSEN